MTLDRSVTLRLAATAALVAVLVFAALPGWLLAQQPTGAGTSSASSSSAAVPQEASASPSAAASAAPATPSSPKATLSDFAWLAGRWQGVWGPRIAQQVWMPPKAGTMVGIFQLAENGETLVIELFTLVEKPSGIDFYFRHFTPQLAPWEKSDPTVLNLASADSKAIVFENPVNGEPKRAVIRRIDADTYVSRSEIVPDKGDMQVIEITYHRQKAVAASRH
ncbi:MAG: DUF6265 family protein [Candidatus Acidiferrales bacterium]